MPHRIPLPKLCSTARLHEAVAAVNDPYLLVTQEDVSVYFAPDALARWVRVADETGAAMVYADFCEADGTRR